jgi:FecR-like protein
MTHQERLGPPPIDPMSEAAWSRVERGLWSRIDVAEAPAAPAPRPRRWPFLAVPLVAAALVAIVIGIGSRPAAVALGDPSRVVSGSSPSSVSFGDIHVELEADTALVMTHETGGPTIALERGAAWFTVAPRGERPPLVVRAGDATVRVVGTRFHVSYSDERSAVEVEHGQVEVVFRGRVARVEADQRWSSESPARTTAAVAPQQRVSAGPDPRAHASRQVPRPPAPAPAPTPTPTPTVARSLAARSPGVPSPGAPSPGGAPPVAGSDDDRDAYERLAALEPTAPDEALAGYLDLARRPTRWADPALYAAGRLAADRHDPRARELLRRYLARFPAGANAADARDLLARIDAEAR